MRDIVSPLAGFSSPFGRGADPYAILGYKPPLVLDYENSKFRVSGSTSTAPSVVTATRTGLATQLNSAGNLVWNAHNLVTHSEDFSNASWLKLAAGTGSVPVVTANQAIAPDGTLTADQVVFDCGAGTTSGDTSRLFLDIIDGFETEARVWIRTDSGSDTISLVNQAAQTNAVVTDEWQLFTVSNNQTSPNFQIRLNGDVASGNTLTVYIWGAHVYRSDLGGMAPVPLTRRVAGSTTYVPTTSAAVYLPREEAYTYVSGSLVGPYYQKESDARTNLVTYSEDFTDASWVKSGVTVSGNTLTATTATSNLISKDPGYTSSTQYTVWAEVEDVDAGFAYVGGFDGTDNFGAIFDLTSGTFVGYRSGSTNDNNFIQQVGPSRYLIACTFTVGTVSASSFGFVVGLSTSGGLNFGSATNGEQIIVHRAQVEQGSTPTSYIPTAGSSVTRPADSTTISAGNMPAYTNALSFQLEGLVTMAEGGGSSFLLIWEKDSSNFISCQIRDIFRRASFTQRESAVSDTIFSAINSLPEYGINVPFNIASRHGSTFINGAVDGTALTADLTPTALPDLSATTFQLAPVFNGFIKTFRVWADDIGDTGIAEASNG